MVTWLFLPFAVNVILNLCNIVLMCIQQFLVYLPDDAAERRLSLLKVSAMSSTLSFLCTSIQASFSPQYSKKLKSQNVNKTKCKSRCNLLKLTFLSVALGKAFFTNDPGWWSSPRWGTRV